MITKEPSKSKNSDIAPPKMRDMADPGECEGRYIVNLGVLDDNLFWSSKDLSERIGANNKSTDVNEFELLGNSQS
jgi:hypothetical protein